MPEIMYTPTGSQSAEAQTRVEYIIKLLAEKRLGRYNHEVQWQEGALLAWPEHANTFSYGYDQLPGAKKALQQLDSSVQIAAHRFMAIMESLVTPQGKVWSPIRHPDPYVLKQNGVRGYYDSVTTTLHQERYKASSNFVAANQQNMQSLGVFGNMNIFPDRLYSHIGEKGLHYSPVPVGEVYYIKNHQGTIDAFIRTMRLTAREIYTQWPDLMPQALQAPLERGSIQKYWVIQYVCPRSDDYMPWVFGPKNKPWAAYFISETGKILLEESGYRTFPLPHGRYAVAPDEDYGRGPMQMVLATGKTKNSMKGVFMEQGYRAGKPTYLLPESGLINPQWHPGGMITGGMSDSGKVRVGVLPVGNINITKEMMDEEQLIIDDAFLVTLFKWCLQVKDMPTLNARQVVEMLERHAMFLAPVTGLIMNGYLSNLVPRELDLLSHQNMFPPVPPALREAGGPEWEQGVFDNAMTRMQAASEVAGYMQAVEMTETVVKSTGDESHWDVFAFKRSLPEISLRRGFPERWLSTPQEQAAAAKQRAAAQERDFQVKSLPGKAAMAKAQAITAKAATGGNTGGTLSGTPEGGMPMMPGQGGPPPMPAGQ